MHISILILHLQGLLLNLLDVWAFVIAILIDTGRSNAGGGGFGSLQGLGGLLLG